MTKNELKRIPQLRKEIAHALNLWENAIESATRKTSIITGMPKGNNVSSQVENAVIKADTYKEKYDELCNELKQIYDSIKATSKKMLNEQESKVIESVYIKNKRMSEIAKEMNITERHVYRLKKQAIYKICW